MQHHQNKHPKGRIPMGQSGGYLENTPIQKMKPSKKVPIVIICIFIIFLSMVIGCIISNINKPGSFYCDRDQGLCQVENSKRKTSKQFNLTDISYAEILSKEMCDNSNDCGTVYAVALALKNGGRTSVYGCASLKFECDRYVNEINAFLNGQEKTLLLKDRHIGAYIALTIFVLIIAGLILLLKKTLTGEIKFYSS